MIELLHIYVVYITHGMWVNVLSISSYILLLYIYFHSGYGVDRVVTMEEGVKNKMQKSPINSPIQKNNETTV